MSFVKRKIGFLRKRRIRSFLRQNFLCKMIHVCNRGERMSKILVFLLIVGVLIAGTLSIVEEICEDASQEQVDFSDGGDFGDLGSGDLITNGGGSGGEGPAPG
jgi:hypothetical protein